MKYVLGLDISRYEPKIDWAQLRAQGVKFVIIKATEGATYQDSLFATHWANAKNAGMIRGAYHYLRAGDDANLQAQSFLKTAKLESGDLPAFLDLEGTYNDGQSNANFISRAQTWLTKVEQATGKRPFVYSTASFLQEHLSANGKAPSWAKDYATWIANYLYTYTESSQPIEAPGWKPWVFWQYTNHSEVQGIYTDIGQRPSEIDANWFRGSLQDLYTLAGAKAPVPTKYIVKAGDTFSSIAAQNNLTLDDLLAANPNLVQVGAQLDIPAPILVVPPPVVTPPVVTPPVVTPPVVTPPIVKPPVVTPLVVTPTTPDPIPSGPIQYTIQPGDSLTRIAAKYGVTVDAIARANNISNPNLIQVGQKLIIPKP